ncbi:MAG: hypothetical protein KQJ78_08615 [Deltaproteobacteria bacterium]|nr:hypothetical protein [Deltaproteobacteria bacterium]
MAEVIDISQRQAKENKKRDARARRKAQAVAAALSCGMCPRRCAYCGLPVESYTPPPAEAPYPFCDPCLEEYRAFARQEAGGGGPEAFWHTEEWARMWHNWLAYMKASESFRRSAAFQRLMEEFSD